MSRGSAGFATAAAALALTILLGLAPSAEAAPAAGKVVVLVLDRVSISDFPSKATPFCESLAKKWSCGLMVTRTDDSRGENGSEYVTMGAGVRAMGAPEAGLSFNSDEVFTDGNTATAGELYRGYQGLLPPAGGVVCLGWQQIADSNGKTGGEETVGALGSTLVEAVRTCAVLGNSDSYGHSRRLAPLICAERVGSVAMGDVAGLVIPSPGTAGGVRTDYAALEVRVREFLESADLIVVDTGDTARIDREQPVSSEAALEEQRNAALRRFDRFARRVVGALDMEESLLLIVSPSAPAESVREHNYLTPLIAAGRGFGRGRLTSASTRKAGLVSNTDFLPTVLDFFGLEAPGGAVGSPFVTSAGVVDVLGLKRLSEQVPETSRARLPVVFVGGSIAIIISLLSALCYLSAKGRIRWPKRPGRLAGVIAPAALVLLSAPLACIVVSVYSYRGYAFPVLFCTAFSLVLGLAAWGLSKLRRGPDPVVTVALVTVAVIIVDLLTGGRLMMLPLLGSGALDGLRFYGLSNLMVGVLVVLTLWAAAGLAVPSTGGVTGDHPAARVRRPWVYAMLAAVVLFTGLGALGANLGGFAAASVAFLVFAFCLSDRGLTKFRAFVVVPAATAAGLAAIVGLDAMFFHTHASRSLGGGAGRLIPILGRKLTIHTSEIEYMLVPALLLVAGILAAALWMRRPGSCWDEQWRRYPGRSAALYAVLVGGLVGLVLNDTGITLLVAMALLSTLTMTYYAASTSFGAPETGAAPAPVATPAG